MKVLFALTSHGELGKSNRQTGWYLSEAAHPWKALHERGIHVDFVSPRGGACPLDPTSFDLSDPVCKQFWEDPEVQRRLMNTITANQVDANSCQAIHFVGGHGVMWDFPSNIPLANLAARIYEHGGIISSVCHGAAGLLNLKVQGNYIVRGKKVACFTNAEEDAVDCTKWVPYSLENCMKERGALVQVGDKWTSNVIVDGRVITGQNPQSATELGKKLVELLNGSLPSQ
ncbi:hypothetical protein CYY_001858 [Polysphondylium violaceum]|uniref:DJ-1/PfpI domain-containing protein n=1 Tax=Polysphondylium violaceum TaxID=133409 RepID=A0A8J4V188_9MYCE|nr:hypothetical protein CYY_001858 [Polysphondylium violaceum]